jgi:hypothetical protein
MSDGTLGLLVPFQSPLDESLVDIQVFELVQKFNKYPAKTIYKQTRESSDSNCGLL